MNDAALGEKTETDYSATLFLPQTDFPMRAGLPEPLINHELLTAGGIVFHGDLVYPDRRLVIEYDGEHHWTDPRQRSADTDRLWMIEQAGWRFLHFSARHLANGAAVAVARTKAALRE